MSADILIVDDEEDIRNLIHGILEDEGYSPRQASSAKTAYAEIESKIPDIILQDIWLQDSSDDGLQILEKIKSKYPQIEVIMISGHGTIETAVNAIKKGAYDFIEKPFKTDRLLIMIKRLLESQALKKENEQLKKRVDTIKDETVGDSPIIKNLQQVLDKASPTNSRILITGEPGSGKNLAARYIHHHSHRADKPFLSLNCASSDPDKLEHEIFGTVDGYMNEPAQPGRMVLANGGTLVLDEVAELPFEIQGKLVRVLQEEAFQKLGSNQSINIDIRFISSSCRDLAEAIKEGTFRQDLFYRLNVIPLHIPPLRERRNDIPVLVEKIFESLSKQKGANYSFTVNAIAALQAYDWPGNMRQLRNTLEWVIIMNSSNQKTIFDVEDLPPEITGCVSANNAQEAGAGGQRNFMHMGLREARENFERDYLISQIRRFGGNISKTAQFIGMERSALHRKLKTLDIFPDENNNKGSDAIKSRKSA